MLYRRFYSHFNIKLFLRIVFLFGFNLYGNQQLVFAQNINDANNINQTNKAAISRNSAINQQELIENNKNKSSYALYKDEINKRFKGGDWEKNLTQLNERALMQEYARIIGISNHLSAMNIQKKERIEALLATYTSMQLQIKQKQQKYQN